MSATSQVGAEEPISFGRRVTMLAEERPGDPALIFVPSEGPEVPVSWGELEASANRTARRLAAVGVDSRSLLAIGLPNCVEHIVATLAGWKLGACVLPLRWDLPDWERDRLLEVAQPSVIVADWDLAGWPGHQLRRNELDDGTGSAEPLPDIVADPARAIATSGSTGTPKIIVSRNPGRGVPSQSLHNPSGRFMGHRAGQVQLIPAPLYHTNGFLILHNALFDGQSVLLMERFDAARMVDLIERYRVNTFVAVTIMLLRMARLPDIDRRDFSSVESLLHGGAMLPQWLARKWIDLVGPEHFFIAYGSSENAGSSMVRGDTWLEHPGTVGQPWQCDIKILDADGQELPPGEVGEIFMRWTGQTEPSFEYRGGQPRTREDLFSSIGDLGWLDDDGFLFLADRRDDLIISGGANIFAAEVEAALSDHPGVADVVVVGLADDEWGQRVHAVVQLSGEGATAEELRDHCRHRLASYKVPKSFAFVERLARTEAGKIRRSDYRSGTPTG